eukprot:TRINITY_DN32843_c0_g1_i1.p1 TRINITY_DN32843_c0_g1~~TRINITY_DN32843_c0_g1_i1.p1  ORF type:complete len:245 (+),score=17.90 TRINITY_DN32843_c0_g1_i1:65-736(+)
MSHITATRSAFYDTVHKFERFISEFVVSDLSPPASASGLSGLRGTSSDLALAPAHSDDELAEVEASPVSCDDMSSGCAVSSVDAVLVAPAPEQCPVGLDQHDEDVFEAEFICDYLQHVLFDRHDFSKFVDLMNLASVPEDLVNGLHSVIVSNALWEFSWRSKGNMKKFKRCTSRSWFEHLHLESQFSSDGIASWQDRVDDAVVLTILRILQSIAEHIDPAVLR